MLNVLWQINGTSRRAARCLEVQMLVAFRLILLLLWGGRKSVRMLRLQCADTTGDGSFELLGKVEAL